MPKNSDFYHNGFAWICRHCERDMQQKEVEKTKRASIFTQGEAESRSPDLATKAIAKWADPARRFLMCPRCGIVSDTELH